MKLRTVKAGHPGGHQTDYNPKDTLVILAAIHKKMERRGHKVVLWYHSSGIHKSRITMVLVPNKNDVIQLEGRIAADVLGFGCRRYIGLYNYLAIQEELADDIEFVIGGDKNKTTTKSNNVNRLCYGGSKFGRSGYTTI